MLTKELSIVKYEGIRAYPDRLTQKAHAHYRDHARQMLEIYSNGPGLVRRDLHSAVEKLFVDEPDCDPRRIRAFCKLLDEAGKYQQDKGGAAARLRLKVFSLASEKHPLVSVRTELFEHQEEEVKNEIAEKIGRPWDEIEQALYCDVIAFNRLEEFHGYDSPDQLLARYNVAQVQACLYSAVSATVEIEEDFRVVLRSAKLARLLHEIKKIGKNRYRLDLTGPASLMRKTRIYGPAFAKFFASLLTCRNWTMEARLLTPWNSRARLSLSNNDGLGGNLKSAPEFDSGVEEKFADKFGENRDGWTLFREGAILHKGQKTYVPDFTFRHEDGTEVLM